MKKLGKALFLDRDGTLIEHIPYLHDADEVRLVDGASIALQNARDADFLLFLFTNQSGVGRGMFTMAEVEACNNRMIELLGLGKAVFTRICIATEMPGEASRYRKPSPAFITEMLSRYSLDPSMCWMIGDSDCDAEAARNAGIGFLRVGERLHLPEAVDLAVRMANQV